MQYIGHLKGTSFLKPTVFLANSTSMLGNKNTSINSTNTTTIPLNATKTALVQRCVPRVAFKD